MEIGIVGLPNVGKSTLFNALTGAGIAAENFPFTTIEPNVGIVPLTDPRLDVLAKINRSAKIVPSGIRFVDIAGLVKGASQGEGLGNKFLANIRAVDAITQVVRCFVDDNVVNVMPTLDPVEAAEIIETELLLADLQQAEKALERVIKPARAGDKPSQEKAAVLESIIAGFNQGKTIRGQKLPLESVREFQFLTAKPLLYVANTDEANSCPDLVEKLRQRAQQEGAGLVQLCAKMEAEIVELPVEDRQGYYDSAGIATPGLAKLAAAGKDLLNLISFFTSGEQESRLWLVAKGTKAPQAAGKIHSDMERGFIRAEIYRYADMVTYQSEPALRAKGLITLEGKEYEMRDGDVVYFRFSV
ncbi:MAG: redox-regulated ATPase YchF [Candidatus Omnitrophica bacterium]|nr:redox-regulated ATPase YchF [Candidatus Omnitrophota bacterium]